MTYEFWQDADIQSRAVPLKLDEFCCLVPLPPRNEPVHSKGDQPWVFFGRTDAKAETPILWPLHAKS